MVGTNHLNGDPRFKAILDEMWALHCKKGNDYGSGGDFLANLRASEDYGIPAWVGALVRENDKLIRLKNAAKGGSLVNESVEDSLIDNACYAVLALLLYREAHCPSRDAIGPDETWVAKLTCGHSVSQGYLESEGKKGIAPDDKVFCPYCRALHLVEELNGVWKQES